MVFLDYANRFAAIADAKWKMVDDREKKTSAYLKADLCQMAGYAILNKLMTEAFLNHIFSALLLKFCHKKQENFEASL